ncbi:selenophosphate synthase [Spirosomataceae bacterium TFI 002]|nr:selenophosphate synthase [Spirosomataceae bacterium TFI 002]
MKEEIKLTQYSHGAGCGCKISPKVLDVILKGNISMPNNERLIVGNSSKDDAAVLDLGNGTALISTTDFFMPIVDDPYNFGRIASANAISDVYAMGGKPVLAIAILGWPIDKLSPEVAQRVIDGSRSICLEAGISLGGGHSIDSPEPIFGLAVNGIVDIKNIKQNNKAEEGDVLFLTKPIGVGILTTAEKKGLLKPEHTELAAKQMMQLNKIGEELGKLESVNAITDVTGFGLLGHLTEMAEGSELSAEIYSSRVPLICEELKEYISAGAVPGGSNRNWDSYGHKIGELTDLQKILFADPQTSGGLLVSVSPEAVDEVQALFADNNLEAFLEPIGKMVKKGENVVEILA